jgi:hypothetical protein
MPDCACGISRQVNPGISAALSAPACPRVPAASAWPSRSALSCGSELSNESSCAPSLASARVSALTALEVVEVERHERAIEEHAAGHELQHERRRHRLDRLAERVGGLPRDRMARVVQHDRLHQRVQVAHQCPHAPA